MKAVSTEGHRVRRPVDPDSERRSGGHQAGRVRPLAQADLPQIVDLYARIFLRSERPAPEAVRAYLEEIFCRNPWSDETMPSLVYERHDGRIIGCLGVMPRRMSMNGRPVRMAVSHHVMVEPGGRSTLAAVELVKTYFAGPQDLSIAEGSAALRRIWEGFRGTTALLYGIRWTRPVRLGRYVLSLMRRRGLPPLLTLGLQALCPVVDALAGRLPQSPFRPAAPQTAGEELDARTLARCVAECTQGRALRPEYDERSLEWLLGLLSRKAHLGTLRKVLVRDGTNGPVGWYLYYLSPAGMGTVVQVGARRDSMAAVLDHLFYDAWQHGAVAVAGQADPEFMHVLSERDCVLRRDAGSPGLFVRSRRPELLRAVLRGDAFLTRLEGEWWIGFGRLDA